jgi:GTP-binding protein
MEIHKFEKAQFKSSIINAQSAMDFSKNEVHEIVFFGRSNVGKSSLINFLTNNNNLARVSKTPGRTRAINFFEASLKKIPIALIDLPGYGYANLPHSDKYNLSLLLRNYLVDNKKFKFLIHLLDCRRDLSNEDIELSGKIRLMSHNYIIVMTKIDKISISKRENLKKKFVKVLDLQQNQCFQISIKEKIGKNNLLDALQ